MIPSISAPRYSSMWSTKDVLLKSLRTNSIDPIIPPFPGCHKWFIQPSNNRAPCFFFFFFSLSLAFTGTQTRPIHPVRAAWPRYLSSLFFLLFFLTGSYKVSWRERLHHSVPQETVKRSDVRRTKMSRLWFAEAWRKHVKINSILGGRIFIYPSRTLGERSASSTKKIHVKLSTGSGHVIENKRPIKFELAAQWGGGGWGCIS